MDGFLLLVGHLVGDFILQEDLQANHKTTAWPGPNPSKAYAKVLASRPPGVVPSPAESLQQNVEYVAWLDRRRAWMIGNVACSVHVSLYTLAVWAFSWPWLPFWGLVAIWMTHWPIDRFGLACWWMTHVSNQKAFATGPLSPWSVVIVDQCFHLLVLAALAVLTHP